MAKNQIKNRMKRLVVFVLLQLIVSCVQSDKNNNTLFPQLLFGEYQINAKSMIPCDPMRKNKYQINWRLNKISPTKTEFEGNFTIANIPFDDTLKLQANFDQKDSYGGWITNAIIFKKDKACTAFKSVVKEKYWKTFGCSDGCACPIRPGVYVLNGFPASNMENVINFPKLFFYGTYKFRFSIINKNNEQIGCVTPVLEIKRKWEQP